MLETDAERERGLSVLGAAGAGAATCSLECTGGCQYARNAPGAIRGTVRATGAAAAIAAAAAAGGAAAAALHAGAAEVDMSKCPSIAVTCPVLATGTASAGGGGALAAAGGGGERARVA